MFHRARTQGGHTPRTPQVSWLGAARLPLAALLLAFGTLQVSAHTAVFDVGRQGWIVERFGPGVAVLRTPGPAATHAAGDAAVLLSCAGADRRIRLAWPRSGVGLRRPPGVALVRAAPAGVPAGSATTVLRATQPDASTLLFSGVATPAMDPVAAIARALLETPRALDIVVSPGIVPVAFTRLVVYRLRETLRPDDKASIRIFLAACGASIPTAD